MSKSATLPRVRSKARPASVRPRLVEHELDRAQTRIRTIDTLSSLALLAGGILAYVLVVIAVDYWLRLSDLTRQILWGVAGIAAVVFLAMRVIRPLVQRINPYYAARAIEKATPQSKNGIINWLDLRDRPISPIIRDALSRRAVHELDSADMEQAIPSRRPIQFALAIGVIVMGIIIMAWFLPDQMGSLFKRALFPFKSVIIPTQTRLEVISPVNEPVPEAEPETLEVRDVPVERGQPVDFRVITHGVAPTEVFFESQAAGDRAAISKPMRQEKKNDPQSPWRVALSSSDIPVDGFVFWFRANDGKTRQFRLIVTSKVPPAVSDLSVHLLFPKYTKQRPQQQGMGPIEKVIEGTKAQIEVTADKAVESGALELFRETPSADGGEPIRARLETIPLVRPQGVTDDNKLVLQRVLELTAKHVADKSKREKVKYQLTLTTPPIKAGSEARLSGTSPAYEVEVLADEAPKVVIEKIKDAPPPKDQELEVEANAVLPIAGKIHDDVAVGNVSLKLKNHIDGRELYFLREAPLEKNLQKATGFRPPPVDFLLTLDLAKVTYDGPDQKPGAEPRQEAKLQPGTVLELVVEARDTAEPTPHVGVSPTVQLKIKGVAKEEERKEQEKKAQDQQQKHDQQKKDRQQRDASQQQDENENKDEQKQKDEKEIDQDNRNPDLNNQREPNKGQQDKQNPQDKKDQGQPQDPKNQKDQNQDNKDPNQDQKNPAQGEKNQPNEKDANKKDGNNGKPDQKPDKSNQRNEDKGNPQDNKDAASKDGNQKDGNQKGDPKDGNQANSKDNKTGERNPDNKQGNDKNRQDGNQSGDKTQDRPPDAKGDQNQRSNDKKPGDKDQKNPSGKPDSNKGDQNQTEPKGGEPDKGDPNKPDQKSANKNQGNDKGQPNDKNKPQGDKNKPGDQSDKDMKDGNQSDQRDPSNKSEKDQNKQGNDKNKPGEQKDGNQSEKKQGDKDKSGDKDKGDQGDKKPGDQEQSGDKQKGDQSDKKDGNDKQGDQKKPGDQKGEGEPKDQKQPGQGEQGSEKKEPKPGEEKGDSGNEKKDGEGNKPGEKQKDKDGAGDKPGDKEKKDGEGGDKPGEKQGNEKTKPQPGDKQEKGEGQGKEGDKEAPDSKPGKGEKPGDQKGDQQSGKQPGDKKGNDKADELMKEGSDDSKEPSKDFKPNQAGNLPGDKHSPQEVDAEAAKKNNLALETMLDKLRKGEIDKKLADALKKQNLTREEAIKLLENKKLDRVRGSGGLNIGPGKSLTTMKNGTEQVISPTQDVPDELSSSYRTFTQKRNQQPQQPRR